MGCITLLTDFGLDDASVAAAKGILMQNAPNMPIIDISHHTKAFQVHQAAYLLAKTYKNFPQDTYHVIVCDVFAKKNTALILCKKDGQYFFSADDFLLSYALHGQYDAAYKLTDIKPSDHVHNLMAIISETINRLEQNGETDLALPSATLKPPPQEWFATVEGNTLLCRVLHIDNFGNVVLNTTQDDFEKIRSGRRFKIEFMRNETMTEISNHYSSVAEHRKLCRFNSAGYLEVCVNRSSAAQVFGFELYDEKHILYTTIKIIFE